MTRRHEVPFLKACFIVLWLSAASWAAPVSGAAQSHEPGPTSRPRRASAPSLDERPIAVREDGRGLLVRAWVNGVGPFVFAVDTGAGATILSRAAAEAASLETSAGTPVTVGGLSGARPVSASRVAIRRLALGEPDRPVPARGVSLVVDQLPAAVDGILDPTEAFAPLGFSIDIRRGELRLFDPASSPVRGDEPPPDGAVVKWLTGATDRRPYVLLNGGRRALLDTGSGLGLVLSERDAGTFGVRFSRDDESRAMRDVAGGVTWARRVRPVTVTLDGLTLGGIPTDVVAGTNPAAPPLLGRDALRPFEVVFDPVNRLIAFSPGR